MSALMPKRHAVSAEIVTQRVQLRRHRLIIAVSALLPALLVGLRATTVGSDTSGTAYTYFVQYVVQNNALSPELMYTLVAKIGYFLFGTYNGMLFAVAYVSFFVMFYAIAEYRFSIHTGMAACVYLAFFIAPACNIVRQIMAVSFCFLSLKYIASGKAIRYVATIALAGLCHTSAYLMLMVYVLYHVILKTKSRLLKLIAIGAALISPLYFSAIFEAFIQIPMFSTYSKYLGMMRTGGLVLYNIKIRYLLYALLLIPLIYALWKRRGAYGVNLFFYYPILEAVGVISATYMMWAFRIMYYFTPGYVILIPYVVRRCPKKWRGLYSIAFFAFLLYYFIVYHYLWGNDAIFPYAIC